VPEFCNYQFKTVNQLENMEIITDTLEMQVQFPKQEYKNVRLTLFHQIPSIASEFYPLVNKESVPCQRNSCQ